MQITLEINGEKKNFTAPKARFRKLREAFEVNEELTKNTSSPESIDRLANYIVDIFGKQFTADDLYDSYYSDEIFPLFQDILKGLTGQVNSRANQLAALQGKNA